MYLNKQKKPNGDVYLSIREKYLVSKKGSRERTIESLGYLSELKQTYDDPIAFFTQKAKEMTVEKRNHKFVTISIECDAKMSTQTYVQEICLSRTLTVRTITLTLVVLTWIPLTIAEILLIRMGILLLQNIENRDQKRTIVQTPLLKWDCLWIGMVFHWLLIFFQEMNPKRFI